MKVIYRPENEKQTYISKDEWPDILKSIPGMTLIKNEIKSHNGHFVRGENCDALEVVETITRLNEEKGKEEYGVCLDIGVCNICGQNMYEFIISLGSSLKAVIFRDNSGNRDEWLLPFASVADGKSNTDWRAVICGLRKIDFDGTLILDYSDSIYALPLQLRSKYIEFVKTVGEYFKWQIEQEKVLKQYDKRVLFGAGNMCRNYMKCYGEDFPPLFTCDNNSKLWGAMLEGIEVKNPEELRNIPQDCAIFICNVYYKEIEEQLRKMGIQNKIEYFNDAYLPFLSLD